MNRLVFKKVKKHHIAVAFIILIAIILRLHLVFTQEFSFDERFTYFHAMNNSFVGQFVNPQDDRPPFYYSFVKLILPLSSSKEFLRLPSLIFSILSAVFIYKTFHFFSKKAALYALIFYSTHSLLIHVSWQARDYSLLLMLATATVYFLVKILSDIYLNKIIAKIDIFVLLITILLGVLTTYLFYPFISVILFVFGLLLVFFRKKISLKNISILKKSSILLLPVIAVAVYYLLDGFQRVVSFNQLHDTAYKDVVLQMFIELFSMTGYWFLTKNIWLPLVIVFSMVIIILYTYLKIKKSDIKQILIPFFSLSSSLLVVGYSLFSEIFVNLWIPRGWVVLVIFSTFIIAIGWSLLEEMLPRRFSKKILTVIYLLSIFGIGIFQYGIRYELWSFRDYDEWVYPFPNEKTITGLVDIVTDHMDESTQIITFPDYEMVIFDYAWRGSNFGDSYQQVGLEIPLEFKSIIKNDSELSDFFTHRLQRLNKVIIVVNLYAGYEMFKHDDPYFLFQAKLFNFINTYCEKEWEEKGIFNAYDVWGCTMRSLNDD